MRRFLRAIVLSFISILVTPLFALADTGGLLIGQRYQLTRDLAGDVALAVGQEVEVLGFREGGWVRIGRDIDLELEPGASSDMWIRVDDLIRAGPRWMDFAEFSIDAVLLKEKMTYCYRDVKNWLLSRGICGHYPSGEFAFQGYSILQRECGMRPVRFAKNAPLGTVCVSKGGRSCGRVACGHIAVKVAGGTWYGAGNKSTPWLKGRTPIGCLYKGKAHSRPNRDEDWDDDDDYEYGED